MSSARSIDNANSKPSNDMQERPTHVDEKTFNPWSPKFLTVLIGMYMSVFLVALDRTIIAVAIPAITNGFHSISDIGWYGSSYMLTASCFNPIFGRIYQLYSTKWVFLVSIIIFEVGSAVCGAAPSSASFIVGRAIAGLGSAGIFQGGMMVLVGTVPLGRRPMFTAIFGMTFGVSAVLGPVIGGSLTDHLTWRFCFFLNLPIGAFTILAILLFFHMDPPNREHLTVLEQIKRLDPIGVFFFVPSIVCLILALQWGGTTYAWSDPKIIGLLVTFAVLLVAFTVVEILTPETAMAPTRVILNRSVAGSMVYTFLNYGSIMAIAYYLAFWFQSVKGETATHAGINTFPMVISMVVASIISAKITQRIGYYIPGMICSSILSAIGAGMLSTMTQYSDHSYWIGYQVLFGFGLGCGAQQASLASQSVLPKKDVPLGLALGFLMQQLGGSVFLAVCQNLLSTKLVDRLSGVAGLDAQKIVNTGATDIRKVVPAEEISAVVNAYNYSVTRIFVLAAIISACTIVGVAMMEWKSIKDVKDAKQREHAPNNDEGAEKV